jgi:hypothetical protein
MPGWWRSFCKDDRQGQQHRADLELEACIKLRYNDYIKSGLLVLARAEPDVHSGCFHQCLSKSTPRAAALMYHRLQHSGIVEALGMAADAEQWVNPPEAAVDQQHILVNLDCDNIIGARFIESAVAFFGISVGGKIKRSANVTRGQESSTTGRIGY